MATFQGSLQAASTKEGGGQVPCRVASTADLALSGTLTVDGVVTSVGDRVLVKNQSTASENGIYVVQSGAWTRANDFDSSIQEALKAGSSWYVQEGTANAENTFVLTTLGSIVVGTTGVAFALIGGGGGGGGEDLAATLVLGNATGGTDIEITTIDGIPDAIRGPDGNPGFAPEDGGSLRLIPGSGTPATFATGTFTINAAPVAAGDILYLDVAGNPFLLRDLTGVAGARTPGANDFDATIGTTTGLAAEIAAAINDAANNWDNYVTAAAVGNTVVLTSVTPGVLASSREIYATCATPGDITPTAATAFTDGLAAGNNGSIRIGRDHSINGIPDAAIVGGRDNTISYAVGFSPFGGQASGIFAGYNNRISTGSFGYGNVILGGFGNRIGYGSTFYNDGIYGAAIVGGGGNQILDYGGNSVILGGWNNRIGGGPYPYYFHPGSLVSGQANVVEGAPPWGGGYFSFTAGRANLNRGGQNSGIIGRFCEVHSQNSFAGGNVVVNYGYGTFMWGQNHESTPAGDNFYCAFGMAFGASAYLYNRGQAGWSSQNYSLFSRGGAQRCSYSLQILTSNATPAILTMGGTTTANQANRMRIMPGRVYAFRIQVAAYQYGGAAGAVADSATWEITGAIKRDLANNTTLLGLTGAGSPLYNDAAAAGWNVAVTADDTNEALRITVTGEASKSIVWHAAVYTSEAGRDT